MSQVACTLKEQANELTKKGQKAQDSATKHRYFVEACGLYAKAIEEISRLEWNMEQVIDDSVADLKPSLFLNLALCNFLMRDFDASFVCSNVSVALCNNPYMKLNCLQEHIDPSTICAVTYPVVT